jgi:hypothetical protein
MKWLRSSTGIVPCAIMSDCALAIKKGVSNAYTDLGRHAPKVYWCLFHVVKAFKNRALFFLRKRSDEAVKEFQHIIYSQNPEHSFLSFYAKWSSVNLNFVDYVKTQWHTNIIHWAVFYRTVSGPFIPIITLIIFLIKLFHLDPSSRYTHEQLYRSLASDFERAVCRYSRAASDR